ncbi:MAG: DUF192 domain-containing protein [Elusimicrobiota bacterium]
MIFFNKTRNAAAAARVLKADTFSSRLFGLIPRKTLEPEEGLWLDPCAMIHTCFMSFPIDAVFLDAGLKVVKVVPSLKPWRFSPWVYGAKSVLELAPGRASAVLAEGDFLEVR